MFRTTCFAISFRNPVIEPEVSRRITISLGDADALMYLKRRKFLKNNTMLGKIFQKIDFSWELCYLSGPYEGLN